MRPIGVARTPAEPLLARRRRIAGLVGKVLINLPYRHSGEGRNPVSLRQRVDAPRLWVPDIASRFRD